MVIYIDVLIFVNAVTDFFLLLLTSKAAKAKLRPRRAVVGALVSSLYSLAIVLPPLGILVRAAIMFLMAALTVIVSFGFVNARVYFRNIFCFFTASFLYGGAMTALCELFSPAVITAANGAVYLDISPVLLVSCSAAIYGLLTLFKKLLERRSNNCKRCSVSITDSKNTISTDAIIDTGNSLNDIMTGHRVILVERKIGKTLFPLLDTENVCNNLITDKRFRVIPYRTVAGKSLLPAFVCDRAVLDGKAVEKPLVAVCNIDFGDDYGAVIGSDFFDTEI